MISRAILVAATVGLALAAGALAACGGRQSAGGGPANAVDPDPEPARPAPARDDRTAIEKRRDTACDQLGHKLTRCAVDDARAELAAGRMSKQDFELNTAPGVQRQLTEEFVGKCKVDMSSRQVRVLEVCLREETACAPLVSCLGHLNDGTGLGNN